MKFIKTYWLQLFILIIPFFCILFFWNDLPATIPTHWKLNGTADGFSDSPYAIFFLPLINLFNFWSMFWIPAIDPKQKVEQFKSVLKIAITLAMLVTLGIFFIQVFVSVGIMDSPGFIFKLMLPALFLVLGNYIGKVRPNYFLGVRTPWTLEYEDIWVKTHRLTGYIWVISSLVMGIFAFLLSDGLYESGFILYLLAVIAFPILYSYLLYREKSTENGAS